MQLTLNERLLCVLIIAQIAFFVIFVVPEIINNHKKNKRRKARQKETGDS